MKTLQVQHAKGVEILTLFRPERFNAFNREMALALQNALLAADKNPEVRVILLTGEGKAFSSGQDLSEAIDPNGPGLDRILKEHYNPLALGMRSVMKPIVVAVNGVAAGAGANLALLGDIVVAAEGARFIQAFSKIGLIPDTGGTLTLPRLVGPGRAAAWMMLGDSISAQEAKSAGMIYEVYPAETFSHDALRLAQRLADAPTKALALTKQALNASTFAGLEAHLETEWRLQIEASQSHDFQEGVTAFLEKRSPQFLGR